MRRLTRPLMYLGTFGIVLALARVHAQFIGHYVFQSSDRLPWTFAYGAILSLAAYGVGLPDIVRRIRSSVLLAASAALVGAISISAVQVVLGSLLLPRFVIVLSAAAVVPWYAVCSALASRGRSRDAQRDRVVAVVTVEEAQSLRAELAQAPERDAVLVAALTVELACSSRDACEPLVEAVTAHSASVVILDRWAQASESIVAQAAALHEGGVRIRTLSLFYEEWLGKLPLSELERVSLMFDIGELHRAQYGRVKRLADVVLGVAGLVVLVPVTLLVVAGNLVANRGRLVYRQPRVGKNGVVFNMVKFRTMRAEHSGSEWTTLEDPRVTPFGRWLRKTHLDELPQVLNVVKGDLSIVGPRPEQPKYAAELRDKIPFYDLRQSVRPGLTGWAQVKYRYAASELDALEKLQYEFYYLSHQNLLLDLRIVGRTLRSVVRRDGR